MDLKQLIETWHAQAPHGLTRERYGVHLPLDAAAKLEALAEIFPLRTREQLITELLTVALEEVVEAFSYVKGDKIIRRDEEGDPIYEDIGLTPRYLELVRKHVEQLQRERD